jgi:DNA replication initiation complex subunit (GINS family)
VTLDLDELVKEEQTSDSLAPARDNLYEVARNYLSHLRRDRDEHDSPHTKEAQRANDEYEAAEAKFDKLRAIRQRKINVAVFSPGDVSREVEKNLTETEREYVEKVSEADEELRRTSVDGDGIGQTVEVTR